MGNFVAGAAADHAGGTEAKKHIEKTRDTVGLVNSMVAIESYWTSRYAE